MTKALYYRMLKYQEENLKLLHTHFEVVELDSPLEDTDEILKDIEVGFAPLGFKYDKEKIDRMPKLRCIASNTTGEPHIDRAYAESKGIKVFSLKFEQEFLATITPTAEHTWGLLLAVLRHTPSAYEAALAGRWDRRPFGGAAMLSQLSIGIAGLGRLGSLVAEYAKAFRMKEIRFYDPFVAKGHIEGLTKVSSLRELVDGVDVVSIHIPAEDATHKIFNKDLFGKFKKGSYLINTSRGELVDEAALLEALESGHLGGAALDVFDGEYETNHDELWQNHPLLRYAKNHGNLLITPHIGGSTYDAWRLTERRTIDLVLTELSLP